MSTNESLRNIASRLYKENICLTPLDERSLETISDYMNHYSSYNDLCRRFADVELNYVQISSDADEACLSVIEAQNAVIEVCRKVTDQWQQKGYLQNYFFYSAEIHSSDIHSIYLKALDFIRNQLKIFSDALLIISETAAQIRACSASFGEIYKESKLAIYASMLNRDIEAILDCRSTSLQAHASTKECEKLSSKLMGNARNCTKIINCINNMIIDVNQSLNIDNYEYEINLKMSPMKANYSICSAITVLENINIEKYNY